MRAFLPIVLFIGILSPVDLVRQTSAITQPSKKLLFLTHDGLYKHTSLGPAEGAVTELGKQGGFAVTTVEGYKQDASRLDLAFLVVFGPLHAHAIQTASSGIFRTLEEACASAEDRAPSPITWREA